MLEDSVLEGFCVRLLHALEGIQTSLEEIANIRRQTFELDIDTRAKANALTDETMGMFKGLIPQVLSTLGIDPEENENT